MCSWNLQSSVESQAIGADRTVVHQAHFPFTVTMKLDQISQPPHNCILDSGISRRRSTISRPGHGKPPPWLSALSLHFLICQLDAEDPAEDTDFLEVMEPKDGKEQEATCWTSSWKYYVSKNEISIVLTELFVTTASLPYQSMNHLQDIMIQSMHRMTWDTIKRRCTSAGVGYQRELPRRRNT